MYYNYEQKWSDQDEERLANEINSPEPASDDTPKKFSFSLSRKKEVKDSIYNVSTPKVLDFKVPGDAVGMGFCTFLKEEYIGVKLSEQQQSDVFMNSVIV